MARERFEILNAFTEHPDMECMWSQRQSCRHTCSHALLSFAVCLLFVWNICLQLQLYANLDMLTRCSDIHEPLKGEMKNSITKNSEVYPVYSFEIGLMIYSLTVILEDFKIHGGFLIFSICFLHFRILLFKVYLDYDEAVGVSIILFVSKHSRKHKSFFMQTIFICFY